MFTGDFKHGLLTLDDKNNRITSQQNKEKKNKSKKSF